MDVRKRSLFSVNGVKVKEVYRVNGAIAHRGRSLISTIALLLMLSFYSLKSLFHSCPLFRVNGRFPVAPNFLCIYSGMQPLRISDTDLCRPVATVRATVSKHR